MNRDYFRPVGPLGDGIRVRFSTVRGTVSGSVLQYEAWIEERHRPVVRYDTAHGFPHRDLLDWEGMTVAKT